MSPELEKLAKKIEGNLVQDYGIDPLLVIAIANIIINVIKALSIIYFNGNLAKFLSKPNLLTKIIVKREINKEIRKGALKHSDKENLEKDLKHQILSVVQNYGEEELSKVISSIK